MAPRTLSLALSLLSAAWLPGCGRSPAPPSEPTILSAESAYFAMDLPLARRILERLVEDRTTAPKDLAGALRRLALQDWRFFKDDARARQRLERADRVGVERSATWASMSRIARETGSYDEALNAARKALNAAENRSDRETARMAFCRAAVDEAAQALARGGRPDRSRLDEARRMLDAILLEEPGQYEASKAMLGIALLQQDGPAALSAWRLYFQLRSGQAPDNLLGEPYRELNAVLPGWRESPLAREERVRLVLALAGSRFFRYAALMARGDSIDALPAVQDVLGYADFLNEIQRIAEDYYRGVALGRNAEEVFKKELEAAFAGLWGRLRFEGRRPQYNQARFLEQLRSRFGTEMRLGANGNFGGFDLIMGHRVGLDTKTVEQYGRRVELRLVTIDMMVENGYSGWFWDGRAAPGGWGAFPEIAWIREAYLPEPYHNWRQLTDAGERSEKEKENALLGAADDGLARANPYSYLPGVTGRIHFDQMRRLYESLKAQGYAGDDLCLAFVSEFLRIKLESSIFAHEGRHAIDQAFFPWRGRLWSASDVELRAKLSEVAFAPDPKFALVGGSILGDRNIAGRSAHSAANLRIKKALLRWMESHSAEIEGLDRSRPLLPQLDLLTSEQIIRTCREADPMAP